MKTEICQLITKYKHQLLYLIFGGLTTVINFSTYYFCAHILLMGIIISTLIAKVLALLVAYLTNRKWVFGSSRTKKSQILKEGIMFYGCRACTTLLDVVLMYLGAVILGINDLFMKILSTFTIIVMNYFMSKFIVFK